jgi:hypothetical protein
MHHIQYNIIYTKNPLNIKKVFIIVSREKITMKRFKLKLDCVKKYSIFKRNFIHFIIVTCYY